MENIISQYHAYTLTSSNHHPPLVKLNICMEPDVNIVVARRRVLQNGLTGSLCCSHPGPPVIISVWTKSIRACAAYLTLKCKISLYNYKNSNQPVALVTAWSRFDSQTMWLKAAWYVTKEHERSGWNRRVLNSAAALCLKCPHVLKLQF